MSTKLLLPFILSSILPLSAFAQAAAPAKGAPAGAAKNDLLPATTLPLAQPAPDAAELTRLLEEFLAGASRNDTAIHERFWADDLIYTSALGRRKGKADIMRELREEAAPKVDDETATYTAEDIRIQQYGTTAIVVFRLVAKTVKAGKTEISNYLNSGTFLKRDGKWQAVSWQATKAPAGDEPGK